MGRSVRVSIGGREFSSKKAAADYFMGQREAVKAAGPVTEGALFEELKELYLRYYEACENWDLNGRAITAFSVDYEPRQNGQTWAAYLCYWAHFSSKQALPFSVKRAIDTVTKFESRPTR
ncbi:TPA: hypothetical protein ACKFMW_004321 [Enterobacter hormaechei]